MNSEVGVRIACQTSDTDPIVVESNNPNPKVAVRGENGDPFVWFIIYRSRSILEMWMVD